MSSSADWNSLPQLKLQMSLGEWSSSCCRLFFILWARSSRPRPTTCTSSVPVLCFTRYFALITSDKTAAHREIQDWIYFSYLVGGGSDRRRDLHTVSAALLVYSRIAVPCTISIPVSVGKCSQWQINTWISGNVTSAVLKVTSWQWGIGMFAIIYPVCTIPLLAVLFVGHLKARRANPQAYKFSLLDQGVGQFFIDLFWYLDVVGICS